MSRIGHIALALLVCGVSIPVLAGAMTACGPQLHAAPRACCGTHCTCGPKAACVCRPSPAPDGPQPAQGALVTSVIDVRHPFGPAASGASHPADGHGADDLAAVLHGAADARVTPAPQDPGLALLVPLRI
jgi:hypothetical protein